MSTSQPNVLVKCFCKGVFPPHGVAVLLLMAAVGIGLLTDSPQAAGEPASGERQQPPAPEEPKVRTTFQGHTEEVGSVAFSPAGTILASGGCDLTLRLWDAATGRQQASFSGHTGVILSLAFSPDGKTVASSGFSRVVKLWDVSSSRNTATLTVPTPDLLFYAVAFSPDGKTVAAGTSDGRVQLWDPHTGKEQATLTGHTNEVLALAFSPDGKTLASADGAIKVWSVATRKERASIPSRAVRALAFSPDGKMLASSGTDLTIKLWEVATGRERTALVGHRKRPGYVIGVPSVVFGRDGRTLVSGGGDATLRVWRLSDGTNTVTWQGHAKSITSVALSPDGKVLASASHDKTVKLWDLAALMQRTWKAEPVQAALSPRTLQNLWTDLATGDAKVAYRAMGTLVAAPQPAVTLLKDRLQLPSEAAPQQVTGWIADLGHSKFAVRRHATEALGRMSDLAEPALRQRLMEKPALEVRRRIEQLLTPIEREKIRTSRAVEVLEHIGNSEARQVLTTMATGPKRAWLTREAKTSLDRLTKRVRASP